MKSPAFLLLIVGIGLTFLKIKHLFVVNTWWIVFCFAISFLIFYVSIHKKNKESATPKPVYFAEPNNNSFS